MIQPIKNANKISGDFTVEISKERLRCLVNAIRRECLEGEPSAFDDEEFVILNFCKVGNESRVTFCEVKKENTVVLSRE